MASVTRLKLASYRSFEEGTRRMSMSGLNRIALKFGVSVKHLLGMGPAVTEGQALEAACHIINEFYGGCPTHQFETWFQDCDKLCDDLTDTPWKCWRTWLLAGAPGYEREE